MLLVFGGLPASGKSTVSNDVARRLGAAYLREAWRNVGQSFGVQVIEFELLCSDQAEHKNRVETRITNIEGLDFLLGLTCRTTIMRGGRVTGLQSTHQAKPLIRVSREHLLQSETLFPTESALGRALPAADQTGPRTDHVLNCQIIH